ncbi:hypothetical protein GQ42DRAFT_77628 [Ramicandelaber brevisporus]|nr:hypothetical protein GQ42DRAFT_77628 [Ramicandelaber brevisporus]
MERCLGTTKLHNGAPCKRERPRLVFLFLFLSCSCSCSCAALFCSALRCSLWHPQIAQRSLVQPFTLPLIHPLSQAADRKSSTAACPPPVCVPLVPRIRLVRCIRRIRRILRVPRFRSQLQLQLQPLPQLQRQLQPHLSSRQHTALNHASLPPEPPPAILTSRRTACATCASTATTSSRTGCACAWSTSTRTGPVPSVRRSAAGRRTRSTTTRGSIRSDARRSTALHCHDQP